MSIFEPHTRWAHRNFLDVFFEVQKRFCYAKGCKLKVSWYLKAGQPLGVTERIFVQRKDIQHYYPVC